MKESLFRSPEAAIKCNGRVKYLPDESGEYQPYELTVFDRPTYIPPGWESADGSGAKRKSGDADQADRTDLSDEEKAVENRRKSYNRAKNQLFDILMCTLSFDSFITLTLDADQIDRYDYDAIMKRLSTWLDNRVRRKALDYVLVPERHKDGAVHFHGLCNMSALQTERARSAKSGRLLYDSAKRPIYNVTDFSLGFSTLIPLSGDNARIAAAKYCYKYITKTHGEKVGGRYYLSGGKLGRAHYALVDADFEAIDAPIISIGDGYAHIKKIKI